MYKGVLRLACNFCSFMKGVYVLVLGLSYLSWGLCIEHGPIRALGLLSWCGFRVWGLYREILDHVKQV